MRVAADRAISSADTVTDSTCQQRFVLPRWQLAAEASAPHERPAALYRLRHAPVDEKACAATHGADCQASLPGPLDSRSARVTFGVFPWLAR